MKILILLVLLFSACVVWAQIPQTIDYQGRLADNDGNYINGDVTITFLIYDSEVAGTALWSETQTATLANGIFHVQLGSIVPVSGVFDGSDRWLGINISGEDLLPRTTFASVPYSIKAEDADLLGGLNSSSFALSAHNHAASNITSGTLDTGRYSAYSDLSAEGYLNDDSNSDLLTRVQGDTRWVDTTGDTMTGNLVVNADFQATGITHDSSGDAGTSGQILSSTVTGTDWIDTAASGDITSVAAGTGLTGGGASGDVILNADLAGNGAATTIARSDHNHDANYVDEGQANSVTSSMIVNGTVSVSDLQDGACLTEILDDDGPGSNLNADYLDGLSSSSFGDIMAVTAGTGLNGGGTSGTVTLSVDPTDFNAVPVNSGTGSQINLSDTAQTLRQTSINVPVAGRVVVMANLDVAKHTTASAYANFWLSTSATSTSGQSPTSVGWGTSSTASVEYSNVALSTVYSVSAGTTTVYLRGVMNAAGQSFYALRGNITLLFVPN